MDFALATCMSIFSYNLFNSATFSGRWGEAALNVLKRAKGHVRDYSYDVWPSRRSAHMPENKTETK